MELTLSGSKELKKFILLQVIKEEAHRQLSYYRQRQDDLVARMATEWPTWGCTLDFYTHMILPLLRNSFILHFINLSEGFCLEDMEIKFGCYQSGKLQFINEEFYLPADQGSDKRIADLLDFALYSLTGVTDINTSESALPLSRTLENWKVDFKNRHPLLVRIRDADIGSQSFFALVEGIVRNASKHGKSIESCKVLDANDKAIEAINDIKQGIRYDREKKALVVTEDLTEKTKDDLLQNLESIYKEAINQLFREIHSDLPKKKFRIKIIFCDTWEGVDNLVNVSSPYVDDSERYGFVIVSVNRDLINEQCTIEKQERKVGDRTLVEFLTERFKEGIIDDTGRINPGGWGIKEMKICAAFLSGEPLYAVNESDQSFIYVGKTSGKGIWEDKRERLCYVFRIGKPRLAIAIVPDDKRPHNINEWKSVRFVSNIDEVFKRDVDYDFLFVYKKLKEQQVENFLKTNWHVLPKRIVYGDLVSSKETEFNCELYGKLLFQYMDTLDKRENINIRIYFDDDHRSETWKSSFQPTLEIKDGERIKRVLLAFPKKNCSIFDYNYNMGYQIAVCRHKDLQQLDIPGKPRAVSPAGCYSFYPYYAQKVSGADPFFSFLMCIDPKQAPDLANLVMLQVIESTLLNVLIIDERIAYSLCGLKAKDEPAISLAEKLYWMGICVAGSIKIDGDKQVWSIGSDKDKLASNRLVDISISSEGLIDNTIDKIRIHILLIHVTRLNEIFDSLKCQGLDMDKETFIKKLQDRIPNVVIHSGRGRTEGDIPEKIPFVEYSTVEKYVLNEPSKFYLVQVILNVKGELE